MERITVTFVSNYINHHQLPLSNALYNDEEIDYKFIETEKMDEERIRMGWSFDTNEVPYLMRMYDEKAECEKLIMDSDIVIFGGTDDESIIMPRLLSDKPVIRYSERIYKEGQWKFISPRGLIKKYKDHIRFKKKKVYMLCAGAYVASDFNLIKAYPGKMFRWGYFPAVYDYDEYDLMERKSIDEVKLLWTGRMIDWKHPEYAVEAAYYLKKNNVRFHLTMIGDGDRKENVSALINKYGLNENVTLLGFVKPDMVRNCMMDSNIYLFTSDEKEGWGAVLNEAMNSGAAVVASALIGAAPYLIKNNVNGMVFRNKDVSHFTKVVYDLCMDRQKTLRLGMEGYATVHNKWNPSEAALRLKSFMRALLNDSVEPRIDDGPLSVAPIISPKKGYKYFTD